MQTREFTKTDWYGLAGAEGPEGGGEPRIAHVELPDGGGLEVVVDRNSVQAIYCDKDGDASDVWNLNVPFALGCVIVAGLPEVPSADLWEKLGFERLWAAVVESEEES